MEVEGVALLKFQLYPKIVEAHSDALAETEKVSPLHIPGGMETVIRGRDFTVMFCVGVVKEPQIF